MQLLQQLGWLNVETDPPAELVGVSVWVQRSVTHRYTTTAYRRGSEWFRLDGQRIENVKAWRECQ